uniref:Uncharacterized protein n=1 Tax=Brevundimonas basaltis TaxID=472166 RepID=A0A7W8HYX4_9CAUL|nr:hypothetical protein [Brevundimonas basaltis]
MLALEPARERRRALDLETAGGGVGCGAIRPPFGGFQTTGCETEGVPAEAEPPAQPYQRDRKRDHEQQPSRRRQGAQDGRGGHGNTARSSSKCGPSRSVGQSPPQTMAVP